MEENLTTKKKYYYKKQTELADEDKEHLDQVFEDFINKHGHEVVKDIYKMSRKIRNELQVAHLPMFLLYRKSLFIKMETDYFSCTTEEIAEKEDIKIRTAHNYRKSYYEERKVLSKIRQDKTK